MDFQNTEVSFFTHNINVFLKVHVLLRHCLFVYFLASVYRNSDYQNFILSSSLTENVFVFLIGCCFFNNPVLVPLVYSSAWNIVVRLFSLMNCRSSGLHNPDISLFRRCRSVWESSVNQLITVSNSSKCLCSQSSLLLKNYIASPFLVVSHVASQH